MNKQGPPTYQQSEGMSNPHYTGPDPIYPNTTQEYHQKNLQTYPSQPHTYPLPTQEHSYPPPPQINANPPYPVENLHQQQPTIVTAVQHPGTSVHVVGPPSIVAPPISVVAPQYVGPHPTTMMCHNCREHVTTHVRTESGLLAWLVAGGCCLFGCWFGCCLIPFCMDSCKDSYHTCPRCNTFLGKYSKLR